MAMKNKANYERGIVAQGYIRRKGIGNSNFAP
jgi:hypothetical protein